MQIVDIPAMFPGCCVVTKGSGGPVLDLECEIYHDGRGYLALPVCEEIARAIGAVPVGEADALREQLQAAEERIAELEAGAEEAERLEEAVAATLERGAVVDAKTGRIKLRPRGGKGAPEINKRLVGAA